MCFGQFMAVLAKPAPVDSVVGHNVRYLLPEGIRVVHVRQVAELVDNDIVRDLGRRHHKAVVKRQSTRLGAASPTGFLISDGNFVINAAGQFLQLGTAPWKIGFRSI